MRSQRRFLAGAGALLGAPYGVVFAQGSLPRVAFLGLGGEGGDELDQFKRGMREHGYVDGSNVRLEVPNLDGRYEGMPALLEGLIQRDVRVIVTRGSTATNAAKKATQSVPIVMIAGLDPVKSGFAASLARPGGNLTGITIILQEWLRSGSNYYATSCRAWRGLACSSIQTARAASARWKETRAAAKPARLDLHVVEARATADLERAFAQLAGAKVQAVLATPSTMFTKNRKAMRPRDP